MPLKKNSKASEKKSSLVQKSFKKRAKKSALRRKKNPLGSYFLSFLKIVFCLFCLVLGALLVHSKSFSFKTSLFGDPSIEGGLVENNQNLVFSGKVQVEKFFPPEKIEMTDFRGESHEYPFFQRSRTLVPRLKLAEWKSGWMVRFTLDPQNEKPEVKELKNPEKEGVFKVRFTQMSPGKHELLVEVLDQRGEVLAKIEHRSISILEKSMVLLGDNVWSSLAGEEGGDIDGVTFNSKKPSFESFLEAAYAKKGKTVFPLNLSSGGQSPLDFLKYWENDGRKERLFSLDGKREHESFLAVDEIWIGYAHTSVKRGHSVSDYIYELETLVDELLKRDIKADQIVLLEPTFSAVYDMKDFRSALIELAQKKGLRLAPQLYEMVRDEYGKMVSLEQEPLLKPYGMRAVTEKLVQSFQAER